MTKDDDQLHQQSKHSIGLDPMRTPVLYADSVRITSNDNGFVFDIAQGIAGTKNSVIVARIGMSREHAKKLAEMIGKQLMKRGEFMSQKTSAVN